MLDHDTLKHLANGTFENPVLSVYVRIDPRDPSNASPPYAWAIELRNALRDVAAEAGSKEAVTKLTERVEAEITTMDPSKRGRGVIWFIDTAGETTQRLDGLHLPPRQTLAMLDVRPFISPLVEWLDHGSETGIVLIGADEVHVMEWAQGCVRSENGATFELELGDWRDYGGGGPGVPGRVQHHNSHTEHYEARVDDHRHKLYAQAARAVEQRGASLGWQRVVLIGEGQHLHAFDSELPEQLRRKVVKQLDHNASRDDSYAIEQLLDPVLEELHAGRAAETIAEAQRRAQAGGAATLGPDETLVALTEGRVDHLVLDPTFDFSALEAVFAQLPLEGPATLLAERAVEVATGTGAHVSAIDAGDAPALADAGGMAALLRY